MALYCINNAMHKFIGVLDKCAIPWPCIRRRMAFTLVVLLSLPLHRADETQPGRNSCPRLHFSLQFGLYRVIALLTLFMCSHFWLLISSPYPGFVHQQHFRSWSPCHFFTSFSWIVIMRKLNFESKTKL